MKLRIRKTAPIDRKYSVYEILSGEEILFDIGKTDDGEYDMGINQSRGGMFMLEDVLSAIEEAKRLIEKDEEEETTAPSNDPVK